jgi:hypothetical protein
MSFLFSVLAWVVSVITYFKVLKLYEIHKGHPDL